jgi:hypothetical protein
MCHRRLTRPTRILEWLREAQKSTQKLAPKVLVQLAVSPGSSDASCANAVVPSCAAVPFRHVCPMDVNRANAVRGA